MQKAPASDDGGFPVYLLFLRVGGEDRQEAGCSCHLVPVLVAGAVRELLQGSAENLHLLLQGRDLLVMEWVTEHALMIPRQVPSYLWDLILDAVRYRLRFVCGEPPPWPLQRIFALPRQWSCLRRSLRLAARMRAA
jgi:hypothetical protein